jgi:parvulin-like peptidyl-prolyl isomerase
MRAVRLLSLLLLPLLPPCSAAAQPPGTPESEPRLQDRILAVVDEDPILHSDVELVVGLGLTAREPGEGEEDFRRRVLDQLIDQRLRFHEVGRFGEGAVPVEAIEEGVDNVVSQLDGEQQFLERLEALGLTLAEVRQIVARQIAVIEYVNERLGPRVFVGLEDIRTYYEEVLVPTVLARGEEPPPLAEVREAVRQVLQSQRLNEEIERWTAQLRREADVQIVVDDYPESLPPVIERLEEGEPEPGS